MAAECLSHKKILTFFWNEPSLSKRLRVIVLDCHHAAGRLVRHGWYCSRLPYFHLHALSIQMTKGRCHLGHLIGANRA